MLLSAQENKKKRLPNSIIQNEPLNTKNWFGTGGPVRFYSEPTTASEFAQALQFADEEQISIFLLGHGANILISDSGYDGLVIKPMLNKIAIESNINESALLCVEAGVSINDLIEFCLDHELIGLEEFSGIPGTVGGAVFINLHYFEFLLSQFLVAATVIEKKTGIILSVDNAWFNFGYNESKLIEGNHYLIDATFKVKQADKFQIAHARGRRHEIIRHRQKRYPNKGTCGSFFRNFLHHEVTMESNGQKLIWVAYYLDRIGVKGTLNVGDAIVSHQHANMIVNRGTATSADIIALARLMQEKVRDAFGITPQPECRLIGFKEYPLL